MNREHLLNYIHRYLDSDKADIEYVKDKKYFNFNIKNLGFAIMSNDTSCYIRLSECNKYGNVGKSEYLIVSEEEGHVLVDKCVMIINKQEIPYVSNLRNTDMEEPNFYKEQLINILKEKDITKGYQEFKERKNYSIINNFIYKAFLSQEVNAEFLLGNVADDYSPKEYTMTSLPKIVVDVNFKETNDKIRFQIYIAAHRLNEYQMLKCFAKYDMKKERSEEVKLDNIFNSFNGGKELMKEMLDISLSNEKVSGKKPKI